MFVCVELVELDIKFWSEAIICYYVDFFCVITDSPDLFKAHSFSEETEVLMADVSPEVIAAYVDTGEPM